MRQSGILAAGALFALRQQREALVDDHQKAQALARILREGGADVVEPETNIVMLRLAIPADRLVDACRQAGVLFFAMGAELVRLVTHRDVSLEEVSQAGNLVVQRLGQLNRAEP